MLLSEPASRGPSNEWRRAAWAILHAFALMLSLAGVTRAEDAVGEYELKAAFIFNIAKYARWPTTAFADSNAPLVIGVLGKDPFGAALDRVVLNRRIEGRRVVIRRGVTAAEFKGSHLVYIAESERDRFASHCAALESMGVLTVGDAPQRTTAVVLGLDGSRLSFSVSLAAMERSQVQISARLLKFAKEVIRQPGTAAVRNE